MTDCGSKIMVPLIIGALIGLAAYKLSGILVALISVVAILALAYLLWLQFS